MANPRYTKREQGSQKKGGDYMKLLTQEILKRLPAIYSQENEVDPMVVCKFFDPTSTWTWYVLEGEEREDGIIEFFGYVVGHVAELGYFTLADLETAKKGMVGFNAIPIERDASFIPCRLSEVKKRLGL